MQLGLNISLKDRSGPYRDVKISIFVPNDFYVSAENTDLSTSGHMHTDMSMSGVNYHPPTIRSDHSAWM